LKATVSAGKTYYVLVTPRMGVWKARFSFQPLRQANLDNKDFQKWDTHTDFVENTPQSQEWAKKNSPDIEGKRARYWPVWQALSPEVQASMTLNPEDGR
jgi:hypothetical protein